MNLTQLASGLNVLYPTRYSHFTKKQTPPFICYIDQESDNFSADNTTYHEITNVDIELYTIEKDLVAEKKIKDFLKENKIPFQESPTTWIESEGVFQCIFSIQLID